MAKFKVTSGVHVSGGVVYKKGDIVESHVDLCRVFKNTFEPVVETTPVAPGSPLRPVAVPAPPGAAQAVKTAAVGQNDAQNAVDVPPAAPTAPATNVATPEGREVTASFPVAVEQSFRVFKTKAGYNVFDAEDMARAVNSSPLAERKDVAKAIKAALGG